MNINSVLKKLKIRINIVNIRLISLFIIFFMCFIKNFFNKFILIFLF